MPEPRTPVREGWAEEAVSSYRPHRRRLVVACVAVLVVALAAGSWWWRSHEEAPAETAPPVACDLFPSDQIAEAYGSRPTGSHRYAPSPIDIFTCMVHFGNQSQTLYIYFSESEYSNLRNMMYRESDVLALGDDPKYSVEAVDLGLGGNAYLITPGTNGNRMSLVWYTGTGRSLSLIVYSREGDPPDAWLAERLTDLATYVATTLETTYPQATPEDTPADTTTP